MDSVVKPSRWFKVRKVLMRSNNPDDVVAVLTNNWNYPVILCRAGKPDVWVPKPQEMPYACIIDVAFLGDNLYGITSYEGLVVMELGEDDDGWPIVVDTEHVIGHPPMDEDNDQELGNNDEAVEALENVEPEYNDELSDEEDDEDFEHSKTSCDKEELDDDEEATADENGMLKQDDEDGDDDDDDDDDDNEEESGKQLETNETSSGDNGCNMVPGNEDLIFIEEPICFICNYWHLIESNGKLFMVKRTKHILTRGRPFNTKVEVLEADMDAGAWVPAAGGGGDARTRRSSSATASPSPFLWPEMPEKTSHATSQMSMMLCRRRDLYTNTSTQSRPGFSHRS